MEQKIQFIRDWRRSAMTVSDLCVVYGINGGIRWAGRWLNISQALVDQYVGLEEIDEGQWDVYFGPLRLGRLHENLMTIEPTFDSISSRV